MVAYSVTVSEKEDAQTVMDIYTKLSTKQATKEEIDLKALNDISDKISSKRTLIRDIKEPVMLTVSLVKFPCVNKAKFCKRALTNNQNNNDDNEVNKMSEKTDKTPNANKTFLENIQDAVNKYRKTSAQKEEVKVDDEDVNAIIDEKLAGIKEDFGKQLDEIQDGIITAIQEISTPTDEDGDDEGGDGGNGDGDGGNDGGSEKSEPEPKEEPKKEPEIKGKGDKGHKHEAPLKHAEPSAQKSRNDARLKGDKNKMTTVKRDEFTLIKEAVKGNISMKGIMPEEISYKASGLTNYNNKYIDTITDPIFERAYKASMGFKDGFTISEADTRKAILTTNLFTTYVQKLLLQDPLLADATYQTGLHGKGYIYEIDDTITTQDGALPENYYFDKDVAEQQATIADREIETYPQRAKITISDRQRLANVYGDDLLNILLDRTMQRLNQGVAIARYYGNKSAGAGVDLQFKRQDGYLKEAGQQLTSSDVNLDKITDLFDTMFYALPEEAQIESECVFYVPTNVRRAFGSYFLDKAADRAIDYIGQKTPLYWGEAEIKVSPVLNNKPMRDALDDGNVSVLLTKPANTHFIVGREAGIEPERYAGTSSTGYYGTTDTANAYGINDYAVRLSLTSEEYAGLIAGNEEDEP